MVRYQPAKNRLLEFFLGGSYICDLHGDVTDQPFHWCIECAAERLREREEAAREARIEEMKEAFIRSGLLPADTTATKA